MLNLKKLSIISSGSIAFLIAVGGVNASADDTTNLSSPLKLLATSTTQPKLAGLVKAVGATNSTQYQLTDLMSQGIMTTKVDGMPAEGQLAAAVIPTAGELMINNNTLLKAGDTIDLGTFDITGKLSDPYTLGFYDSKLTDSSGVQFATLSMSGEHIIVTLNDNFSSTINYSVTFPVKNGGGASTINPNYPTMDFQESWLGHTFNYMIPAKTPDPYTNAEIAAAHQDNFRKYVEVGDGTTTVALGMGYYDLTAINNLLASDGADAGNTNIPTGDFTQVIHLENNPNISGVSSYGTYDQNTVPGYMPDGSMIAQNGQGTGSSRNDGQVIADNPADYIGLTDAQIAAKLQPRHYVVLQQADGTWVVAQNWGTIGSGTGLNAAASATNRGVQNQPWAYTEDGLNKAKNALLSPTNAVNGDSLNGRHTYTVSFKDTSDISLTYVVGNTSQYVGGQLWVSGQDTGIGNIPPSNNGENGTRVQENFYDNSGSVIASSKYLSGWPADNTGGHPADTYNATPLTIKGYTLVGVAGQKDSDGNVIKGGKIITSAPETGAYPLNSEVTTSTPYPVKVNYIYKKNPPVVTKDTIVKTVHYVDQDGKEIAADYSVATPEITKSVDAVTGDETYTPSETATLAGQTNPVIKGYTVTTNPASAENDSTVKFGDDDIDVTVVYTKNAPTVTTDTITKTVHYVDQDGKEISKDYSVATPEITKSVDGVSGDATYTPSETATLAGQANPVIKGYTITENPVGAETDSNVKFGDDDIDLTVVYTKNAPTVTTDTISKTVHYVDESGNKLAADYSAVTPEITKSVDAVTGDATYTPSETATLAGQANPVIKGYTVTATPDGAETDSNVKFGDSDIDLTVVYKKNDPSIDTDVIAKTVHYVDEDGNQLAPDFSVATPEITKSVDAVTGVATYTPSETATLAGQANPVIKGYTVTATPAGAETDSTVKFGDADIDLTVVYKKNDPIVETDVITKTEHYVDQEGHKIAPDHSEATPVITKSVDPVTGTETYSPSKTATLAGQPNPEINGYVVVVNPPEAETDSTVEFGDSDIDVTVVYAKKAATVTTDVITKTIHYVDENGKKIAPDFSVATPVITKSVDPVSGEVTYTPSETATLNGQANPAIKGYTVKTTPTGAETDSNVKFGEDDIDLTVVYKKESSKMSTPPTAPLTKTPGGPSQPAPKNHLPERATVNEFKKIGRNVLPRTGDSSDRIYGIVGLIAFLGAGVIWIKAKKFNFKKKK